MTDTGPGEPGLAAMRDAAQAALERAYAPYSKFRVGAALMGTTGEIVAGCNVENAAYPSGLCAERGALVAAIARGMREFELLVLVSEAESPTPPCGMCRQMLAEFAPALPIVSISRGGTVARWTLRELLPHPFLPASLG